MRVPALQRRHVAALLVASMVLLAGCSGFDSGRPATETTETTAAETTTTTAAETTTTTADSTTTTSDSDEAESSGEDAASADVSGTMTVLLGGSQIRLRGNDGPVTFRDGDRQWFTNESDVTIADALAAQGVVVTDSALTYENTTYDGSSDETTVEARVNGQPVDPTEHTLQDGDSVWVYVDSEAFDLQPPGEYIEQAQDHQHGTIEIVVDGERVDLSADEYQHMDSHFHLEGGDGDTWHAHTWQATFDWALFTLDVEVTSDTVTIDGTTYDGNEDGTTVRLTVNGEPVENPTDYRLKDGDQLRIVVEQSD